MASLKYIANADLMTVTLASAYTAGSGSMSLTAGEGARLPSAGDFWLRTTSGTYRCFKVTARSTDTLTVTGGQDDTVDGDLAAGTTLKWILGASALNQLRADLVQTGAYASAPAANTVPAGTLYLPTDSAYDFLRSNGSAWAHFRNGKQLTPPVLADFAWINQETATAVATYGGIYLATPASATVDFRVLKHAAPGTPYTRTALVNMNLAPANTQAAGLVFRQSSDGKLHIFFIGHNSTSDTDYYLYSAKCNDTSAAGFAAYASSPIEVGYVPWIWLRIADDGANRICSLSYDGVTFHTFHSVGRTDFLTADEVGIFIDPQNATYGTSMWTLHWA